MEIFSSILVYWFRRNGFLHIQGISLADFNNTIPFSIYEPSTESGAGYTLTHDSDGDFDSRLYRPYSSNCFMYFYSSFLNPGSLFVFNLANAKTKNEKTSLVYSLIHSGLEQSKNDFKELTLWTAPAVTTSNNSIKDKILGLSLLLPAFLPKKTSSLSKGVLLIGYGAYGSFLDPVFDPYYLHLVKEWGIAVAICHPRGDGDRGGHWWREGKYEKKINTFLDIEQ